MAERRLPEQEILFPLTLASGHNILYLRLCNRTHSLPYIELWDVPSWNRYRTLFNMRTGLIYGIKLVLIPLILIASIFGAVVGVAMHRSASLREGRYIPFGPFLALAGFAALVADPLTLRHWIGL